MANASGSVIASSEMALRFISMPAFLSPFMPACAYLWNRWLSRGGKKHVLAAGLVLLALAVLACVASWVLYL